MPVNRTTPVHLGRRRWPRRLLIMANGVVVISLLTVGGVYGYLHYRFNQITRVPVAALAPGANGSPAHAGVSPTIKPYSGTAFTVLIVGSDSRKGLTAAEEVQYNKQYGPITGQRSDTIMLVRVDPVSHLIKLMSIPRDLWVPIHGNGPFAGGYSKINAAFNSDNSDTNNSDTNNSGANNLVLTIEEDMGIPINHFIEVGFNAFMRRAPGYRRLQVTWPASSASRASLERCSPRPGPRR